jgi:short subunit dehydrogenase-like uncharacterized protein
MTSENREFDIIVWGASGFTGKLTAEYLLGRYGVGGELKWALGGRNRAKLEATRKELGNESGIAVDDLQIVLGDSQDETSLSEMVTRTKVVCTTVGPYALYGSKLVAACAEHGTSYCDLTGEAHWMQRMIDQHQETAAASNARIVFTCGFDCIPSDLGAHFMQREMQRLHGVACSKIQYRVVGFSGGASGGTIASMLSMMDEAKKDPSVMAAMRDPYALNPNGERTGPDKQEPLGTWMDDHFDQWVAPFVMGAINTKVVRRTNALLDYAYGRDFRYDEGVLCGGGPAGWIKAGATAAGSVAAMGAMAIGPIRRFAAGRLPAPGEGPSKHARESGYFDIKLRGEHPDNPTKTLWGRVRGDRDPGYGSTSKMLGESAVCLALDSLPPGTGISTPAAAMGDKLLDRLIANAGVEFELLEP